MHRIAIIEDHTDSRNLLLLCLSSEIDFAVSTFVSAEAAIHAFRHGCEFDVVVSDICMPGMDGLDFAELIRHELHLSALPMIAVSAHISERDQTAARAAGFNDFLTKPVDLNDLIFRIRALINTD